MGKQWLCIACMLTLLACSDDDASQASAGSVHETNTPGIDHDDVELPVKSAAIQRLAVEQLRRSLPVALGRRPDGEPVSFNVGSRPMLDEMAIALGEPDYVDTTQENLEPSPLYAKLLDDAARSMCSQAIDRDRAIVEADERTLLRFANIEDTTETAPERVRQNLQYLKLRLHAVSLPSDDDGLTAYETLFDAVIAAAANGEPVTEDHVALTWKAICASMVMAPEFHLY